MKVAQNKAFGGSQSFAARPPKNSRKYASTGGWRFAQSITANLSMRPCTKCVLLPTMLCKRAILSLPITRH